MLFSCTLGQGYVYVLAGRPPLAGTVFENTVPVKLYTMYQYHSFRIYYSTLSCSNIMHARAFTCCMACACNLLTRSESSALRAIEAALEAPAAITHDMKGILWGEGGQNRHFVDFHSQRPILAMRSKA